jgi:hypothetical protein
MLLVFFPFKVHILLRVSSLIITLFAFDHQHLISMSHHDHIDTDRSNIWEECQPSVRITSLYDPKVSLHSFVL